MKGAELTDTIQDTITERSFEEVVLSWKIFCFFTYKGRNLKCLHSKPNHQSLVEYERHLKRSKPAQLGVLGISLS